MGSHSKRVQNFISHLTDWLNTPEGRREAVLMEQIARDDVALGKLLMHSYYAKSEGSPKPAS